MSAAISMLWPRKVMKVFATRASTNPCHGFRQLLRSMIWPRCSRRHGSLLMNASSCAYCAGFESEMSCEFSGT